MLEYQYDALKQRCKRSDPSEVRVLAKTSSIARRLCPGALFPRINRLRSDVRATRVIGLGATPLLSGPFAERARLRIASRYIGM